ncbi:carboxymuconolactone decarboxylase family protein [Phyllobacterium endophyticum]|uniref:carboxymuconolactone decarboxylase family protein n=1 Tax=Phyllobacterium endophyticum TaxID=1149773 RepID=UPI002484B586|nr:carboxymuconolactone decarboxylase family protein [Phyllobacterium endophyticum]
MSASWALDKSVFADGALTVHQKQLMAVAVALTTQCPYCIELHTMAARAAGANEMHLAEAALVSAAIRTGGSFTHATHLFENGKCWWQLILCDPGKEAIDKLNRRIAAGKTRLSLTVDQEHLTSFDGKDARYQIKDGQSSLGCRTGKGIGSPCDFVDCNAHARGQCLSTRP